VRPLIREAVHRLRRLRGRSALRHDLTPLSTQFGLDRGTPIDRYYIEKFLAGRSSDIHGTVLEVVDSTYSRRFGGEHVTRQHIVDLHSDNPNATIVGDLADPEVLPKATFDCIILTQTLHIIYDMPAVIRQLRRALRPGGAVLVTVPGITPVRPGSDYRWYWSLTEDSLRRLLGECFGAENVEVASFGNLFASTAFLDGAAVEEVPRDKLEPYDPAYPVTVAARAMA
jgi:SAM-dependent methyltransferase